MKKKYKQHTFNLMVIIFCATSPIAGAIDLSYDANLDAPTSTFTEPETKAKQAKKINKDQPGYVLNNDKQYISPEEGWNIKALSISSDKTPYITDDREAVRISEEQRWVNEAEKNGNGYDENPFNSDNYRITVEAEYAF